MNRKLILMSIVALLFGRHSAFCTANVADNPSNPIPPASDDIAARVAALETASAEKDEEIAKLRKQLDAANAQPKASPDSLLSLLAKGAGMKVEDLAWRVSAGLTPEQAIQVMRAQKNYEATVAKRAELEAEQSAKAAKEKAKK